MLTPQQKERYARAILEIGENKQEELLRKTVLQVGAGGLGSPLSLYLTAMGVGELIIFEFDQVSLSNLGRQIMYKTGDVGISKGQLTKERLEALNPDVKITLIEQKFSEETAQEYLKRADYLVDASDNFETKFLVNDLGLKYNIPFTIAGIQGFEGQLISVIPHKTPCYRCVFGEPPSSKRDSPIPVVGSTCGVVGSLQANEILKGLLNIGHRSLDSLTIISLYDGDFVKIPIKSHPECICQKSTK